MISLVLPYPVSANRYWRSFAHPRTGRVVTIVSDDAREYKAQVARIALVQGLRKPLPGPVSLAFRLVPPNLICMDLDNCLKVAIDALKGIAFEDDSLVAHFEAWKCSPDGHARLEVSVEAAELLPAPIFAGTEHIERTA